MVEGTPRQTYFGAPSAFPCSAIPAALLNYGRVFAGSCSLQRGDDCYGKNILAQSFAMQGVSDPFCVFGILHLYQADSK